MRPRLAVPCPFCGWLPLWSSNEPRLCGCVYMGCPIRGVLMTKEQWEKRA
jgi:hypothetical protein